MKTYEEACYVIGVGAENTEEEVRRVYDEAEKFADFFGEIEQNDLTMDIFVSASRSIGFAPTEDNYEIWICAFRDGLKLGIEMEKS